MIALLKQFLNSTIGTVNAKPLDQMMGVRSVQRGTTSAAGTVTITAVDMNKAFVLSVSKGSAGTVATNSTFKTTTLFNGGGGLVTGGATAIAGVLSGGTTDLFVKLYSAKLTSATTLSCDGACEWQVIEFN